MDESILKPGLDWTRLFMSLTAGAGRRAVNIKTHEKDELNINNYYLSLPLVFFFIRSYGKGKGKADNMKLLALAVPPTQGSILLEAIS